MDKTITKIDVIPKLVTKKRVAAYARVSSSKDAMLHSLAQQVNYYKSLIESNPDWSFGGVYSDEALTGTKDSRAEFQQLLKDCRAGKIDMIITKSISRFARNTVTLLETVRALKAINVDVFFEEQNMHTLSSDGELILTLLATFAQEESRNVSENMKWRIIKDFEQGIMWGGNSCYGYKLINKKLHKVDEESKTVQLIYELYLEGYSDQAICKVLNAKGIKPYKTSEWQRTSVMKILTNNNYTGDLVLQKTYRENHLSKLQKRNTGEHNHYIVSDAHEPIISKEVFHQAQALRKSKTEKNRILTTQDNDFKGLMKCGICHKAYTIKHSNANTAWMCSTLRTKGKDVCYGKQVPNIKMMEASNHILKLDVFDKRLLKSKVAWIEVMPEQRLIFHMKDGSHQTYQWKTSRSESWTEEMKKQARMKTLHRYQGGNNHD